MHKSTRLHFTFAALLLPLFLLTFQHAQAQCTFINNDFETGNLNGWTQSNRSVNVGTWYNYTGTTTPLTLHTISTPPQGTRAAVTDHDAPTTHALFQDFTIPAGQSATLSFFLYYNNTYTSFLTPDTLDYNNNQQYRVDLMTTTAGNESVAASDVLLKLFQTKPGDPLLMSFSQSERDALVTGLTAGTLTRGGVLQRLAENEQFVNARRNQAFVTMQYFGYLRRDPDADGYRFWLNKLDQFNGNFEQAEMVKAFINSGKYRAHFAR